jgi:hypothetical protein
MITGAKEQDSFSQCAEHYRFESNRTVCLSEQNATGAKAIGHFPCTILCNVRLICYVLLSAIFHVKEQYDC